MSSDVAVLMSVYKGDNLVHLTKCIESIVQQSHDAIHLYIAIDGPLEIEVRDYIFSIGRQVNVTIIDGDSSKGLAFRLNQLIDKAFSSKNNYKFMARMDSDDISSLERITKQIEFLNANVHIDVVGSDVIEISEIDEELFYKKMDAEHGVIVKNIIKKCPFNHPSVMFRMSVFKEGFRYKSELKNTQDYYLWVDLLAAGKKFANINEPLLKFRVDNNFHSRRGLDKAINDLNSRVYAFKKLDVLTLSNVFHTVNLFLLRLAPSFIKKWAYKNLR